MKNNYKTSLNYRLIQGLTLLLILISAIYLYKTSPHYEFKYVNSCMNSKLNPYISDELPSEHFMSGYCSIKTPLVAKRGIEYESVFKSVRTSNLSTFLTDYTQSLFVYLIIIVLVRSVVLYIAFGKLK